MILFLIIISINLFLGSKPKRTPNIIIKGMRNYLEISKLPSKITYKKNLKGGLYLVYKQFTFIKEKTESKYTYWQCSQRKTYKYVF